MEIVAWKLAELGLRIVAGLLFGLMAFGWAIALLAALGRFRYIPWR